MHLLPPPASNLTSAAFSLRYCLDNGTMRSGEQLCLVWWLQPPNFGGYSGYMYSHQKEGISPPGESSTLRARAPAHDCRFAPEAANAGE